MALTEKPVRTFSVAIRILTNLNLCVTMMRPPTPFMTNIGSIQRIVFEILLIRRS